MTGASVTDLPPIFDGIEAVCFDAFGTLVEITDRAAGVPAAGDAAPKRRELKHRLTDALYEPADQFYGARSAGVWIGFRQSRSVVLDQGPESEGNICLSPQRSTLC